MQTVHAPHLPVRPEWLALRDEPVLEPALAIVDAHHHLWDRQSGRYLADEFGADVHGGHRVVSTVYVQCRSMLRASGPDAFKPVGEVEFANGIAAMFESGAYGPARCCEAIVGGAELSLGAQLDAVLDTMLQVSGGRLRGIRNPLAWHASPDVRSSPVTPPRDRMSDPAFRQGVTTLARYRLSLDAWVYHTQLDELYDLARACEDVVVVIDHFGGPIGVGPHAGRRAEVHARWKRHLARLAALPNTRMKLGGAGMTVFGYEFAARELPPSSQELAAAWQPYFDTCVELFGVDRCMLESNFPVDKGMFSYRVLWNAFKRLASAMSADERAALFSRTAASTYRIAIPGDNP
ncbi:amidohydrolase family protein [Burkholderia vietnamiensis]|uniref:amidohydrolase family protein n=1 Tax=Burkholderia vietnamiensis TaxID=60552 RepID=UPI001B9CC62C|nr:amidohydrolase family protein [Burkholderia vietnamiensis]MBR8219213.1 amidohydrolase family protein [Burkholderia vietnamiensis]MBR8284801.1 amidohydrolase family protein [Burkholderia vietnamiensis]MCA8016573.1 amidohydrolase family protein [Burkholderia vietnamiensis]MDN8070235.1 amidohydrolase family protein [Burkholderia vietnamiensis]HDR8941884.1 amidohydrolase family protein [Burkholderia vietnamiensis]